MPNSRNPVFRRSPHVVCYWSGGRLIFENYATRARISADPLVCSILDFFDRWRPVGDLASRWNEFRPSTLRDAVNRLVRHSLLERASKAPLRAGLAWTRWKEWNPAAGLFHFSTKDVVYTTDAQAAAQFLRRRARKWPAPPSVKHYPRSHQVRLPSPKVTGEFPRVLLERRTWRRFSPKPIALTTLGTLLRLTWGVQGWRRYPAIGRVALKTSPSGGARHPIEVYALVQRVAGLPRGLYHYAADRHRLELLHPGATFRQAASYLPGQPAFASAAAVFLMTAIFPRCQWKYASPRAYRAVLLDAGHVCQTFCLVATWLGLAPFCTLALADSRIEKALDVDGVAESVVYAAGVAARPDGAARRK